jgi:acetyl esterase/lipase
VPSGFHAFFLFPVTAPKENAMPCPNSTVWLAIAALLSLSAAALPAEPPERPGRGAILRKYDANGDGQLSAEERQALRKDVLEGKLDVPPEIRQRLEAQARQPESRPAAGAAQPSLGALAEKVAIERDVEYGKAGQRPLVLDVVRPKAPAGKALPAVVFIHGGGWRGGDKAGGVPRVVPFAASGNFVGFSVGYRLSGEATWPAQIHDCKAAIRWIRANAEKLGVAPDRIGVWGSSAGGHLVSLLGTSGGVEALEGDCGSPGQSSRVSCVVDFCGPSDFLAIAKLTEGEAPSAVSMLLGGPFSEKQEEAKAASPVTYVSADDPPFLIVHGTDDRTVPLAQAETLYEALKKAGAKPVFVKIEGGGHGIGGPEVGRRVADFFEKHLRGQDVEISADPIRP